MKRLAVILALVALISFPANSQKRTLRVDYIIGGNSQNTQIYLDRLHDAGEWFGRSVNLDRMPPVRGNGSIVMRDSESGALLYSNTFSTLFQEWRLTDEAKRVSRSFENVFLLPMPASKAEITLSLTDEKGEALSTFSHAVDPSDILIARVPSEVPGREVRSLVNSGSSADKIDVVVVAEGYSVAERGKFFDDATRGTEALFSHSPFSEMRGRFNFRAVFLPSADSGVSVPGRGVWRSTALESNYNTFYTDRYLTTQRLFKLHDLLAGVPYEHIIILANDDTYGGGGIYNFYTLTTAGNPRFLQVLAHEFGHSFGALGDEYAYDDMDSVWYPAGVEPWEKNITTCVNFESKWKDLIGLEAPNGELKPFKVGLYEGAGYQTKGAFRPVDGCLMRILQDKQGHPTTFCPVCSRALRELIDFNSR